MSSSEGGQVTGTQDKDYNLIWFTEQCLSNALRLETARAPGRMTARARPVRDESSAERAGRVPL